MQKALRALLACAVMVLVAMPAQAVVTYNLVTDDSFSRTSNTIYQNDPNTESLGNGWLDAAGGSLSIVSNQVVATTGSVVQSSAGIRKTTEWTRDGASVVTQPAYTQSGSAYAPFGCAMAVTGQASSERDGYYAVWNTSGTTGILQLYRSVSSSISSTVATASPTTGPVTSNGFVLVSTKTTTTVGQNIITVGLYYGTASATNPYSGNPASPGTALVSLSYTDTNPGFFNQGSGGYGFTLTGNPVANGGAISRVQTYTAANSLLAQPATPLYAGSTVTVNLTGFGTSWTSTNPTFTATNNNLSTQAAITSQTINSNTSATLQVYTGLNVGSFYISDPSTSGATYGLYITRPQFRIAVVGDSINFFAYGATLKGTGAPIIDVPYWVAQSLMFMPGFNKEVYGNNTGVTGSTTANWVSGGTAFNSNMPAIVQENPDLIYYMLGTNDAATSVTLATWTSNTQSILNYLKANTTSRIVLIPDIPRYDSSATAGMPLIVSYNGALSSFVDGSRIYYDAATAANIYSAFSGRPEVYSANGTADGLNPGSLGMPQLGNLIAQSISAVVNPTPAPSAASSSGGIPHFFSNS